MFNQFDVIKITDVKVNTGKQYIPILKEDMLYIYRKKNAANIKVFKVNF